MRIRRVLSAVTATALTAGLAVISGGAAAATPSPEQQLLDGFEGPSAFDTPYDTGASLTSSTIRRSDPAVATITIGADADVAGNGEGTLRLDYDFGAQPDLDQLSVHGGDVRFGTQGGASGLGMWIYGDASGDRIHVNERPNGGGSVATPTQTIDWRGWKYVEFPFTTVSASDWHLIYSPLVIAPAEGVDKKPHTIFIDDITVLYADGASDATGGTAIPAAPQARSWGAGDLPALQDPTPTHGSASIGAMPELMISALGTISDGSVRMSIDGEAVTPTVEGGTIRHTVTRPLEEGVHRARVSFRDTSAVPEGLMAGTYWDFTVGEAIAVVPSVLSHPIVPELAYTGGEVELSYSMVDAAHADEVVLDLAYDVTALALVGAEAGTGVVRAEGTAVGARVTIADLGGALTAADTLVTVTLRVDDAAPMGATAVASSGTVRTVADTATAHELSAIDVRSLDIVERPA